MKNQEFDNYSFKAPSSEQSQSDIPFEENLPPPRPKISPKDINYRHMETRFSQKPQMSIFDSNINAKIANLNSELEENIKRRMELEGQLDIFERGRKREEEREVFMAYSSGVYKDGKKGAEDFAEMERKVEKMDRMVGTKRPKSPEEVRVRKMQKSKKILLKDTEHEIIPISNRQTILIPIIQTLSSQKQKPLPVYTVPDQIKIQTLLRKVTFPELPSCNIPSLCKQVEHLLAVHQPHSDIHLMLMVIHYHLGNYSKVRKHYEEILQFKVFNAKSHWIAAQGQFSLENYDICLKLTQKCMEQLQDRYLARFIYMKAKCYEEQGNYINSIVCYNQLLKLKPKIADYYLERGILYHRIGYYKEAKEDFTMFGVINPESQAYIKDKILGERNEIRRKELIALLAKIY